MVGLDGDFSVPFQIDSADVRGRFVRLSQTARTVLARHNYPAPVSRLLGEALVLNTLIGAGMKLRHRFTIQAKGDGPVSLLMTEFRVPGLVRGYASYDAERIEAYTGLEDLLGEGHLALTIDQGDDMVPYQGIVPLTGGSIFDCAIDYFDQSEQLVTNVRVAVGEGFLLDEGGESHSGSYAGGIMIQRLAKGGEAAKKVIVTSEEEESWSRANLLLETVQDHELIDPTLTPERVLFRLFHEDGVRAGEHIPIRFECTCDAGRVEDILRRHSPDDLEEMVEDGSITANCQFCSASYKFDPADFGLTSPA